MDEKKKRLALEIQERYDNLPKEITAKDWYALLTIAQKGQQLAALIEEAD